MIKIRNHSLSFALLSIGLLTTRQATAVTWEDQAERLQMVSASFLDAQPLLSPSTEPRRPFRIEGKTVVSILPKMNATVGGKTEQPPQPPAHSIPTIEFSYITPHTILGHGVVRAWQGYLPGSAGKSMGMKATCEQSLTGFTLGLRTDDLGFLTSSLELGQQWNDTKVAGGITEPKAKDLFHVKTKLQFASLTLMPKTISNGWLQVQVTERKIITHFEIPSDGTVFDLTDNGTVNQGNAAMQISAGYHIGYGLQAAVAFLNTPQRSTMPRILLSYSKSFGGGETKTSATFKKKRLVAQKAQEATP